MRQELVFASIRQGGLSAAEGWKLLAPLVDTDDPSTAARLCDTLRMWTWKALDRRRRDDGLREWIDILNRVERFLAERFDRLAAKIEVLADMLHESIAVAELSAAEVNLEHKHVRSILSLLGDQEGEWIDRSALMRALELKPANTTRLMSRLVDRGWVEQKTAGREASYRISPDGIAHSRASVSEAVVSEMPVFDLEEPRPELASFRAFVVVQDMADSFLQELNRHKAAEGQLRHFPEDEIFDLGSLMEADWEFAEDESYRDYQTEPGTAVLVHERVLA